MKKSFVRISALLWADILVKYPLYVMQNYLTDVWGISLTHAAGIINIWNGLSKMLPVFFLFLVDTCLGHFMMLVISSVAYSVGMSFVALSTPPVLHTCKEKEKECIIGDAQRVIFYIGMALIAAGMASHYFIRRFLDEQPEKDNKNTSTADCLKLPTFLVMILIPIIAAIALSYIKPWILKFGIPAIFTTASTILFFSGWFKYEKVKPEGSPITNVCRVFVAFCFKCSKQFQLNSNDLYKKDQKESFTPTRFLRRLEKAAIILPGDVTEGQVKNKWKLCAVSEVEEAKIAVRMVPMWLTFIVCGMVSSIGNTYFIEQANHMNRKIGKWNVPLPALLLLFNWAKDIFSWIADNYLLGKSKKNSEDSSTSHSEENKYIYGPAIGIGIAMVFSILCCITAARIEMKRLKVIRNHGLLHKPSDPIPMSVYWLLFQFFLLAGLDAFSEKCVAAFHINQGPISMKNYLGRFGNFVFGLGFMCNVLSVYVVGKISKRGGKTNWFKFDLNESRLDRYYWLLASLSSVNLVVFIVVACCYRYKNIVKTDEEEKVDVEITIDGAEGQPPQEEAQN